MRFLERHTRDRLRMYLTFLWIGTKVFLMNPMLFLKGEYPLSQLFLLISFIMTVIMLSAVALLSHRRVALRARYTTVTSLASASFGIFFVTALNEIINYDRAYHPDFLILCGITLGFLLAIATAVLYMRSRVGSRGDYHHENVVEQQIRNG